MRRNVRATWMRLGLAGFAVCVSCSEEGGSVTGADGCAEVRYPEVVGEALHVAAACAPDAPDGSRAAPYSTISAALEVAPSGATLLVAPGTYAETLRIDRDVRIIGLVDESKGIILQTPREGDAAIILKQPAPDAAGIILQVPSPDAIGIILKSPSPDEAAIRVEGDASLDLEGVRVVEASRGGVEVLAGSATVTRSRIEGVRAVEGQYGSGLVARAGTELTVRASVVSGCDGVGVYFEGAVGRIEGSSVEDNALGGIRISSVASGSIILQDSVVSGNGVFGVGVFGGRGIILKRTAVVGTTADAFGVGDGVIVAALGGVASSVRIEAGTTLAGNARVGLLVTDGSSATLADAVVTTNERGGIWLQNDAGTNDAEGVDITGTAIVDNRYCGLAATRGASVRLADSAVLATRSHSGFAGLAQVEIGDGVALLAGARARLQGNVIDANVRVGIVADGIAADALYVGGNTITSHPAGIILQHPVDQVPTLAENAFDKNDQDLLVPTAEADALGFPDDLSSGVDR